MIAHLWFCAHYSPKRIQKLAAPSTHRPDRNGDRLLIGPLFICSQSSNRANTNTFEGTYAKIEQGDLNGMNIRMTEKRERALRRLMQATDENTKSKAIDAAVRHYLADLENKQRVANDLTPEHVAELSTPWLPMERPETRVGAHDAGGSGGA